MMIIAVMMSAMLMPAQMMAKNNKRDKAKARVEYRMDNKRDKRNDKFSKARPEKHNDKKFRNRKPARRPMPIAKAKRRAPRPMPIPRPRPVIRTVYHNHCCANEAMETAATIVSIATLAAILAD